VARGLTAGLRHGFPPPPDATRQAGWHEFVREFADEHGWGINTLETTNVDRYRPKACCLRSSDKPEDHFGAADGDSCDDVTTVRVA
jgi:hypothetical protein